ncbi:MAG: VOC family protein [Pelagimonas sp.]|uniref:VOC family protein n=1 Tax=Pelagimonas sp. TaxID=2073170 RepID=UPI003D6A63AD
MSIRWPIQYPITKCKSDLLFAGPRLRLLSKQYREAALERDAIPKGYGSITPYFTVANADAFIEFAETVFDAKVIKEDRYETGRIQHARLRIGNSIIMLNEATATYPANKSQMPLYVDDTETCYTAALAFGATSLMAPNTRPHGDRMAGITDTSGNVWWLTTPQNA